MLACRVFNRFRRDRDVEPECLHRNDPHARRVDDVGHAHEKALSEATSYCTQRGMRASLKQESVTAGRSVDARSELAFECHPTFETASNPRG